MKGEGFCLKLIDSGVWSFLVSLAILMFPIYFSYQNYQESRRMNQALPAYLVQHHCEHVGHVGLSSGRRDSGRIVKEYRCDNGVLLEDEIRDRVHAALRNNKH